MTVVCVLADPPRPGLVFPRLVETSPLDETEAAELYAAALGDVCRAAEASGGDLLVNYRPDEALPEEHAGADGGGDAADGGGDAEREVREALDGALANPDDTRYEVQVGETFAGRAGNTVTHLLEEEGVASAAVVEPSAAFLTRTQVDEAAMKLRRAPVVLGPAPDGRVYYAGFTEPIDFADAYTPPALRTLTDRAGDAGHDVDLLRTLPVVETGADLAAALVRVEIRRAAGQAVPERVSAWLDESGLAVVADDGDRLRLVRD